MDNLQGGTIALEHRYDVTTLHTQLPYVTIYEGVQDPFQHPILIKIFAQEDQTLPPSILDRLFEQTDRLSQLRHQALLKVLDHGELGPGQPFIITEGLDAPTLAELLEIEGTLSPRETTELVERLASALDMLHTRGISHGGVNAQWIYIPHGDPQLAVLDHTALSLPLDDLLAIDGAILDVEGLRALPPEMFRNEANAFTPDADIWALGAMAYQCLVGIHPYFQDLADPSEGMVQIKQFEPRRLEDFGVDPALADIIHQALAQDPLSRWQTAGEFAQHLRHALSDEPMTAPTIVPPAQPATEDADEETTPTSPTPNRTGTIAGLALLLLLVTNLAWCGHAMSGDVQPHVVPDTMTNLPSNPQASLPE